ncbi:hypothetical protein [Bacillus paralicheniformis]|uniref:hypothetical protein n=1 Tax=Bacillus paralicheniformis TaxID=1648923 RepID=UPI002DB94D45|nr:hypothetical protein [Bacillus paralicheniformis]MEC1022888.1 hypothetical protein [Bacillus paralicheniformis]MEC1026504.1 hypothetical protein [Bacillus paralicheniformis]MEC1036943.1 hypothetical protein [Bacillus paralicheniformis]MEC1053292.1 hypothetical protein [Bacillus paralicheniformis]MEC1060011.1 hypothetical protein [Bacillus paralicheniformis]
MQIRYVRTVVGWFNVYISGTEQFVNLDPEEFAALLPQVSRRAFAGCAEISVKAAQELFGQEVRTA